VSAPAAPTQVASAPAASAPAASAPAASVPAGSAPAASAPAAIPSADVTAVPGLIPTPLRRTTAAALAEVAAALPRADGGFTPSMTRQARKSPTNRTSGLTHANGPARTAPAQRTGGPAASRPAQGSSASHAGKKATRRTPAETVAIAARIKAERPTLTETEVAAELGISPSRWRTVRREAAQAADHTLAA
jgi:hypothetical protein